MNRKSFAAITCVLFAFVAGTAAPAALAAKPAAGKSCLKKQSGKKVKVASGATLKCVKVYRGAYRWNVIKAAPAAPGRNIGGA